ncbi:MAG: hypothetical protein KA715_11140 [Xanthomonadaceae bacterium]|nr:hypothetical protein [Xanthomonadaceae bacterium]
MRIPLPTQNHESVSENEKLELESQILKAEIEMMNLVKELKYKQYYETATYLDNAIRNFFTHIRIWIRKGTAPPKVSSQIERLMREIKLRFKKIGTNWSPRGAAQMSKLVLKQNTSGNTWGEYWSEALKLDGKILARYVGVQFVN